MNEPVSDPNPQSATSPALPAHARHGGYGRAVSWSAILAAAAIACALSFILLILGAGLGLSLASPYSYSSAAVGWGAIAWICFAQVAASAVGGYLAGRLRERWEGLHGDEVHFRDTAHGLAAWSISTLAAVAVLAGGIGSAVGLASDAASAEPRSMQAASVLARSSAQGPASKELLAEISGPLSSASAQRLPTLPSGDRAYLARQVAARSGMSAEESAVRVDAAYSQLKSSAEHARRDGAKASIWMFIALLAGAFAASLSATFGGRHRDIVG